jgi:hypothetical protein
MAINDHPDVRCAANWQRAPHHPAVAFVHDRYAPINGVWRPRCAACVQELADDPDPAPYDVVYLDPTRIRGADPDHHSEDLTEALDRIERIHAYNHFDPSRTQFPSP